MVRGSGPSLACLTCLKRKKGCDRQKPACGQCRAACIECAGYTRPIQFKHVEIRQPSARLSGLTELDRGLSNTAFQTKCIGSFWDAYLPNGKAIPSQYTSVGAWIDSVQALVAREDMVRKGLVALSFAALNHFRSEEWMARQSQRLYGQTLRDLSTSIATSKPTERSEKSLMWVTVIGLLSLFEESVHGRQPRTKPAQRDSFIAHRTGETAIYMENQPTFYVSGPAHRIFCDGRMHLTYAALLARKRTFLAEPQWKTVPWIEHDKSPRDHLMDIAVDVPALLEYADSFPSLDPASVAEYQSQLRDACLGLESRLLAWKRNFAGCRSARAQAQSRSTRVDIRSLHVAFLSTLCSAVCIIVYDVLYKLDPSDELRATQELSASCCRDLLAELPILLSPATGLFRLHLATFPLSVVVAFFKSTKLEMRQERQLLAALLSKPESATMYRFFFDMHPGHAS